LSQSSRLRYLTKHFYAGQLDFWPIKFTIVLACLFVTLVANEKAQDVTIKKLTKGNPTMASKFAELKK